MHVPKAFTHQAELDRAIQEITQRLGPDVVHLRYELGDDWTGDPAIFFRIVLSDDAANPDRVHRVAENARRAITAALSPDLEWGVLPYFNFRSQSEQAVLQEEAWA